MNRNREIINGQSELNKARNLTKNKSNLIQNQKQSSALKPKKLRAISCLFRLLFWLLLLILLIIVVGLYVKSKQNKDGLMIKTTRLFC